MQILIGHKFVGESIRSSKSMECLLSTSEKTATQNFYQNLYSRYTDADFKICQYLCLHMKIVYRRIHIKSHFTFCDTYMRGMWNVCLQIFRNNEIRSKLAHFLRNVQTRPGNMGHVPPPCWWPKFFGAFGFQYI